MGKLERREVSKVRQSTYSKCREAIIRVFRLWLPNKQRQVQDDNRKNEIGCNCLRCQTLINSLINGRHDISQ